MNDLIICKNSNDFFFCDLSKLVENLMKNGSAETASNLLFNLYSNEETFPSTEDLNGVADALLRLQDTYKLETSNLANGDIPIDLLHSKFKSKSNDLDHFISKLTLTSGDCFELGKYSFSNEDYYHAVLWMQQALEQYSKEKIKQSNITEILEYLAFSNYQQNNLKEALKFTDMLLEESPDHYRALRNKRYYESELKNSNKLIKKRGDDGSDDVPKDQLNSEQLNPEKEKELSEREIYESLCRGDDRLPQRIKNTLYCHYLDTSQIPYLKLNRIKVEIVYHRPYAVIYHDVVTDNEINTIIRISTPKLKRATVQNSNGDLVTAHYRISKSAWLTNSEDEVIDRLSKRIELITNLSTKTAEELQVVNYGIGGYYDAHYDFARKEEKDAFKSLGTGNRIATWLTYLTDVEAGGSTVFPYLGIGVSPKKASALFWFNLHKSGVGDYLTKHAACPVLIGSKWIANKWLHEYGQEFRRPCGLNIND